MEDKTHSHSHIPAANHVQVLDIYANPKDAELLLGERDFNILNMGHCGASERQI